MTYHCPNCGSEISFGESICPSCKSNVTDVWEQTPQPKSTQPKVAPGMGTAIPNQNSPFPPPAQNNAGSPFPPPAQNNAGSPFPPPNNNGAGSPFPPSPSPSSNPFPSSPSVSNSFPPSNDGQAFPPVQQSGPITPAVYLEIPLIGAKIVIPPTTNKFRIGRDEIQGAATKALPDLNAYKNISRKRDNSEHFIINLQNGIYSVEDIHSTNGTYLSTTKLGSGVPPQPLKDGDMIIVPIEEFGKMVQMEIFFRKP
ncbi:MAG: FHA domain-containing protein [Promethearchaeota archaeon]